MEHDTTLACRTKLARAYNAVERFYEAKELVNSLVVQQEKACGENSVRALNARSDVAVNAYHTGDLKQATAELNTVLKRQCDRHALPETHQEVLKTKNNMANVMMGKGEYRLACTPSACDPMLKPDANWKGEYRVAWKLHQEILDARVQQLGHSHSDSLISMFNLACVASKASWDNDGFRMLSEAARHGFSDVDELNYDTDLGWLRNQDRKRFLEIAKQIEKNKEDAKKNQGRNVTDPLG